MLQPLADYILLEEIPPAETTASGLIHIPQTAQTKFNQGKLLSLGQDIDLEEVEYRVGDILVFPLHSEYRVTHRDGKYILIKSSEVMAKITS